MTTNLIVQLSVIATDQLFSTPKTCKPSLEMIYLTQHYRNNPEAMNTIPIPVCSDSTPTLPLPTVVTTHRYEVLANHHIFFARQKAQCPLAFCLRLNQPERNPGLWQAELQSKDQPVTFNIAALDSVDLAQVFDHLVRNEKGLANLLKRAELMQVLAKHPSRPYWSSWDPIKALAKSHKVTITKKHTNCLDNYFCFEPQSLPTLCINTASAEDISRHLHILPLETGFADQLSRLLPGSPGRPYWSSWDPIKALAKSYKVTITKKHTNCLDNYFSFAPQPLPSLCINTVSSEELSRHVNIFPLETGEAEKLSHQLSGSPSRPYWRNFKDMTKALRDETQFTILKATQTILAKGFHFNLNPAPPPVPNTVRFLLQQMTVKELRREADKRDLAHKEVKKKADLVRFLSSG